MIRYRNGVLNGKGASLLDGYMEDLATDRIYRLMIAQRMRHRDAVEVADDNGQPIKHTPELITQLFDEELQRILSELTAGPNGKTLKDLGTPETFTQARAISESMILNNEVDPI